MLVFVCSFALFVLAFVGMAIGWLVRRRQLAGSCGGLDAIGIEKECDCPEPCEARKAREAARARRLQAGERIL